MVSATPWYLCGRKLRQRSIVRTRSTDKCCKAPGMNALQSIRKYWRYHRPIARPTLFWPNRDSQFERGNGNEALANVPNLFDRNYDADPVVSVLRERICSDELPARCQKYRPGSRSVGGWIVLV